MTYLRGYMEPGKRHSQVHLDAPGLCPLCLERYVDGRDGGGKTALVEELVDGVKTGKWIAGCAPVHSADPLMRQLVVLEQDGDGGGLGIMWSGWPDLNRRPPAPKAGALPGCATPRTRRESYPIIARRP
jgi:hypothetical protein